jgi:putative SOS response-associated peptidase YedK
MGVRRPVGELSLARRDGDALVLTPSAEMVEFHNRMPVILEQQNWPTWLGEVEGDHQALLGPAPDGLLRVWPVDRRVGSPRNNGPELLEPVTA